jgi:hypothetical protein
VHCSLVGRERSHVVEEILSGWLARYGRGREIFDVPEGAVESDPVEKSDRRIEGLSISSESSHDQDAA